MTKILSFNARNSGRSFALVLQWALCVIILAVIPQPQLVADESNSQKIDEFLAARWEAEGIEPAPVASDPEFVRRIYLDLVGRVPTVAERQTFLADERPDKREHLVDALLASEDYVQHFTDTLDTLLMGRGNDNNYRDRARYQWRAWLESGFRDNRPWNETVAETLLARPEIEERQGAVWFLYERNNNYQEIAEAIAPAFFGVRIECAQCHDHMIADEIEQAHYWGLVAFFNRGKNQMSNNVPAIAESAIGGFSDFANLEGTSTPNYLTFLLADDVNEERPAEGVEQQDSDELYAEAIVEGGPRIPKFSRRKQFVEVVVKDHPLIARAFVNRMWAQLLGRGIVHPFDEMDSTHDPSHPELLDWLADDFRQSNYDIRRLVRMLVLSKAYSLSSKRPNGHDDPSFFSWYLERPLTAEQLARSIQQTMRGGFRNDDSLIGNLRRSFPDVMPITITTRIGDALYLSNNPALNEYIAQSQSEGHLLTNLRDLESNEAKVDLAFLTIFGREPTDEEESRIVKFVTASDANGNNVATRWQQVAWAMLTSAEFRFNH